MVIYFEKLEVSFSKPYVLYWETFYIIKDFYFKGYVEEGDF